MGIDAEYLIIVWKGLLYQMAKQKFYAVAAGRKTGIFTDWTTTEKNVKGHKGAKYKSFATRAEAEAWLENPEYTSVKKQKKSGASELRNHIPLPADAIIIYTDGGAINNPGPGGYGIVICENENQQEFSSGFRLTTNNRMEMTAAIVALQKVVGRKKNVVLYSDSSYLVNGIMKGWARKWRQNGWRKADKSPALNADLWAELLDLLEKVKVEFRWVRGHAGDELNERCDRLAVAAARQPDLPVDRGYQPDP